jgi:Copper amine oxidase, enzyme domain
MCRRAATFAGFGMPALFLVIAGAMGNHGSPETSQSPSKSPVESPVQPKIVEQTFPPNGPMETAWKVEWDTVRGFGLFIKNAWFKKGPDEPWMQVLGDARVADIFVPYQPGSPRFWDIAYNFKLSVLSAADAGPSGKLLVAANGDAEEPCVCQEVRDRGVIWKNDHGVRRGHTMALWGCLHAINYRYLIEYNFQDDGCILFKVGATGRNLAGKEWVPHMHNYYWRVDINLDGKDHNSAILMETVEPRDDGQKLASATTHRPFNDGKEGWADWDAAKFPMLRVINTQKKNIRGENYAYDLVPLRHGTSRHFGKNEECSHHDFWVTKANPQELSYRGLPAYCNDEDIVDTDICLWYGTSMFHEPRSEDGIMEKEGFFGATIVSWSGFTLRPNNIFDHTPLFPNPKPPPPPAKRKGKGD